MSCGDHDYDERQAAEIGRKAWKTASKAAKHMSKHSRIVNPSLEKCIPRFERAEVRLGEFLGSGGFNDVYEVERIDLVRDLDDAEHAKKIASPLQQEHRAFISKHVFRESSQNCRYAMKFLSVDTICDPSRFCTGAADLVVVSLYHDRPLLALVVVVDRPPFRNQTLIDRSVPVPVISPSLGGEVPGVAGAPQHH